jgi:hypothetical protein
MSERRISVSKPPYYAALWKSSIWRIQLVSGFHLGRIWATNLRSPAFMSELRLASQPSAFLEGWDSNSARAIHQARRRLSTVSGSPSAPVAKVDRRHATCRSIKLVGFCQLLSSTRRQSLQRPALAAAT